MSSTSAASAPSVHATASWEAAGAFRATGAFQAIEAFNARFAVYSATKLVEAATRVGEAPASAPKKLVYLDVATGTGVTVWEFVKAWQACTHPELLRAVQVEIHATDIAKNMLDIVKQSIPQPLPQGIASVQCSLLNMEDMDAFLAVTPKDSVHLLNCCFGIMFPQKTQDCFNNIYSILAPNGVAAIVTGHYAVFMELLQTLARVQKKIGENDSLPMVAPLLRFGAEWNLRDYLRTAGFKDREVSVHFESLEQKFPISVLMSALKGNPLHAQFVQDEELTLRVLNERAKSDNADGQIILRTTAVTAMCTKTM